MIKIELTFKN